MLLNNLIEAHEVDKNSPTQQCACQYFWVGAVIQLKQIGHMGKKQAEKDTVALTGQLRSNQNSQGMGGGGQRNCWEVVQEKVVELYDCDLFIE